MTRKIKYKEPSTSLKKMAAPDFDNNTRSSIGMEKFIGEYYFISLEKLIPYHKQARKSFPPQEIEELASTIKEHGIKTPLLVISSSEHEGKFEVISGERRLRASQLLNLEKIPCIIIDAKEAEEVALIDNLQRSDLHPVEIGSGIKSLLASSEWGSVSKLATKLGKDQSTISHYLSYSKLPEKIKNHLLENNIRSRDILRNLLKCKNEIDMEKILGLQETEKQTSSKSVLRISYDNNIFKIQDKGVYSLSKKQCNTLYLQLEEIMKKLRELI